MFNKNFYPTSVATLNSMGIDCAGKICLEPEAGKGDIVDWLKAHGAKEVIACELNPDLATIVRTKCRFLGHDFLKVQGEQISHIQLIVMNPPFSDDEAHILHAWEIAPPGCEIIALCNWATLENDYSQSRKQLLKVIEDYGHKTNMDSAFEDSERPTNVHIGLVKLYKPSAGANEFEGFFMEEETEEQGIGIMRYSEIRDVVQRYVAAVKCFEEHEAIAEKMNSLTEKFDVGSFSFHMGYDDEVVNKDDFKKGLQIKAWKYVFNLLDMSKYVTSGVMKDINKFVEQQSNVPFTMKNIYRMLEIIVGTRDQIFERSLVEVIDRFTMHTHENRYGVEGWKTNAGHLLNKKFIVDWCVELRWNSTFIALRSGNNADKIQDLVKVLRHLTATPAEETDSLYNFLRDRSVSTNEWVDYSFFQIKGFKKGTMHLKFKKESDWAMLNRTYGKIKGFVLPEKF